MRRARSSILTLLLALALGILGVSGAQAEDAFYLESSTGMKFGGEYMDSIEPGCWFGPTGNMIPGNAAEDGSIRSDISPFDQCSDAWGGAFGFGLNGQNYFGFEFGAYDWGLASATLDCEGRGVESAEIEGVNPIERLMSAEVDGLTCTIEWLPGARPSPLRRPLSGDRGYAQEPLAAKGWHSRIVSSLATVRGGKAKVRSQIFGRPRREIRDRLTLRMPSGRLIGRGVGSGETGSRAHRITVPLAPFARQLLAEKKDLLVRASLTHADGTPGSGDETSQLVLRAGSPR
jgi:hypothetical protein